MGINFREYEQDNPDPFYKKVYSILGRDQSSLSYTGDSAQQPNSHRMDAIEELQNELYNHVRGNRLSAGEELNDLATAKRLVRDSTVSSIMDMFREAKTRQLANDAIQNPISNIGVYGIDTTRASFASIPLSISPYEATAIYSSGGVPRKIIDIKSSGIAKNGTIFKTSDEEFWDEERLSKLRDAVIKTGFNAANADALRDDAIYGGSLLYPIFECDAGNSYERDIDELAELGILDKDCIHHWAEVDRWNTVFVPHYNPSASDYLHPKHIYVPVSGINLHTGRCALIRARKLPYWGAIYQIGWGVSDLEGWYPASLSYDITTMCMPIIAQQMSLVMYQMPMDQLAAQLNEKTIKMITETNEEQLRNWSIYNPKAVNAVGEIKVIERSFSGFDKFMDAILTDLCARADVPRPALFWTPTKGFTSNSEDTMVQEADMLKTRQKQVEAYYTNLTKVFVAHTFGINSEEYENCKNVYLSFDTPTPSMPGESAEQAARFAATLASMTQAGMPPDASLELAKQFFPNIKISPEIVESAKKEHERMVKNEEETLKIQKESAKNAGGMGANGRPAGKQAPKAKASGKPPKASPSQAKDSLIERFRRKLGIKLDNYTNEQVEYAIAQTIAEDGSDDTAD